MFHYTYLITFPTISKMYIGVRSSAYAPDDDDYTSSSVVVNGLISEGHTYVKKTIETYDTRKDAEDAEIVLHALFDVDVNPCFLNKYCSKPGGWSAAGRAHPFTGKTYEEIYGPDLGQRRKLNLSTKMKNRVFSDKTRQRMANNHSDVSGHFNPRAIGGAVRQGTTILFQFSHKQELEKWLKDNKMPHRAMMQGGTYPKSKSNRNKKYSHLFGIEVIFNGALDQK